MTVVHVPMVHVPVRVKRGTGDEDCECFEPGQPAGDCKTDGHWLCLRCCRCDVDAWSELKENA